MNEAEFVAAYGYRPDTAAKRKALDDGKVPESLRPALESAIEASGIPLEQTAKGWGSGTIFAQIQAELKKGKKR